MKLSGRKSRPEKEQEDVQMDGGSVAAVTRPAEGWKELVKHPAGETGVYSGAVNIPLCCLHTCSGI